MRRQAARRADGKTGPEGARLLGTQGRCCLTLRSSPSSQEAPSHPRRGYPALPPAPPGPRARRPWASSAGLGPPPCAAASTRGASCPPGRGPRPCPRRSLRPAGRPGPCSQTQTLSGTLHLPTPSGGRLRTVGRRPKTWAPRLRGCRRRGREWTGCPPRSSCPRGATAYTGTGAGPASAAAPASPRDPPPLGARNTTLHRKPSHWMGGPAPPACLQPVGPPPYLPHGARHCAQLVGRTIACLRESPPGVAQGGGRCEGEGPASAVTSTFDHVLLLWPLPPGSVPEPPALGAV